jgi:hypothetical protein
MGFTTLTCYLALRKNKGDKDRAIDWLSDYSKELHVPFEHGFEPYFVCSGDCASLLRDYASHTYVDLEDLEESRLQKFFCSSHVSSLLNVVKLSPNMIADIVIRVIPGSWRGIDHVSVSGVSFYNPVMSYLPSLVLFSYHTLLSFLSGLVNFLLHARIASGLFLCGHSFVNIAAITFPQLLSSIALFQQMKASFAIFLLEPLL